MRRDDFKSDEEHHFYLWLLEAQKFGFITDFYYEPREWPISDQQLFDKKVYMKTKTKSEPTKIFTNADDLTYTPDFVFVLSSKGHLLWRDNAFARSIQTQDITNIVYVDVKGTYNPHGGDHRAFFLKQRMMWERHRVLVHKIIPTQFFKQTWAPEPLRWCKGRKTPTMTKLGEKTCTSKEYFEKNKWRMQQTMEGI